MIIHPDTAFPNSTRRSTPHNVQKAYIVIYWIIYRDPREPDRTRLIWRQKKSRWSQMMDPWKRGLGFPCLSEESERWSVGPWAPARFLLSRDERIISRNLTLKCILIGQFLSLCSFSICLNWRIQTCRVPQVQSSSETNYATCLSWSHYAAVLDISRHAKSVFVLNCISTSLYTVDHLCWHVFRSMLRAKVIRLPITYGSSCLGILSPTVYTQKIPGFIRSPNLEPYNLSSIPPHQDC